MNIRVPILFKKNILRGYSYFQDKSVFLIDQIFRILDMKTLLALFFLAAISLVLAFIWIQHSPQNVIFTPEQISYLGMPDTRLQAAFYWIYSVTIFGFFLTTGLFAPNRFENPNNSDWQLSSVIPKWFLPWLGVAFWTIIILTYGRNGHYFGQNGIKTVDLLLGFVAAYLMKETIQDRFRTRTIAIALLSVVIIIYILPLCLPYQLIDSRLFSMDIHWSAVLGDGLYKDTIAGLEFGAFSNYGVLLDELIASSRSIPIFETLAGTVTFLKFISLVFYGLIVVIIFQRIGMKNKRMIWATALLILVVFSGRISGVAETFDAPNQLPIRILMVPVTVILAYLLAGRRGCSGPIIFGLIAPVIFFYNFETGFYCILAMGFAFFIESVKKGVLSVIMSGAAFALSFLLSVSLLMLAIFDGSLGTIFTKLTQIMELKIQSGTSGFAGLTFYFFPPFVLIMIHVAVLFSRYLLSIKDSERLSRVEFQNIVIVGMIIAIGPYVMNRFSITNMLVPFLLYTLLVLPKLTMGPREDRLFWSFILTVLIIPFIFGNPIERVRSEHFLNSFSDKLEDRLAPCLDGITASATLCDYTLQKADELKRLAAENPGLKWLSGLSLNMSRLTGMQPALTQRAPFFFAHRKKTRDILLASLQQFHAPYIAFDKAAFENVAGIPPVVEQFQRNLVRDAGYQIVKETKYWVIARNQDP